MLSRLKKYFCYYPKAFRNWRVVCKPQAAYLYFRHGV
jgi:hypothetical protein